MTAIRENRGMYAEKKKKGRIFRKENPPLCVIHFFQRWWNYCFPNTAS